jgi:hypothetical protein
LYFLVLLHDAEGGPPRAEVEHEPFIDSLIARNAILLGGHFPEPVQPGVSAAYLLRCGTPGEAEAMAATDPLVVTGAAVASVHPWEIVGINPDAIDAGLIVTPGDIGPRPPT